MVTAIAQYSAPGCDTLIMVLPSIFRRRVQCLYGFGIRLHYY